VIAPGDERAGRPPALGADTASSAGLVPTSVPEDAGAFSADLSDDPIFAALAEAPDVHSSMRSNLDRLAATVERLSRRVREAQATADGRALIELAKGVLVERLRCGPTRAAKQLAELADRAGVSQLELAAEIVDQASHDQLTEAARTFVDDVRAEPGTASPSGASASTASTASTVPTVSSVSSAVVRLRTTESGVLAASDTQAVAEALLQHALAPLGATAVAVWAAASDGSLALAGYAGFSETEAARWRHVPPGVATFARRALTERAPVWFADVASTGLPSVAHHEVPGGRAVLPAGTGGRILGVLEICWPHEPPPRSPQIQRQVEALAELCSHTLENRPLAQPAESRPRSAADHALAELVDLADGLLDPAMVLRPEPDALGTLVDFRVHHANTRFTDLAGRTRGDVVGTTLLEAWPLAAHSGLVDELERVHATGESFRAERMTLATLVDQVPLTVTASISITRHGEQLLLLWRVHDETTRLANLLQHAQRLGRIGGFEENLLTQEITWNGELFTLYGLAQNSAPVSVQHLAQHAHPDDSGTIDRFLRTLLHLRRPASTAFRLRRADGIVRHIRVIAEPVLDATNRLLSVRGAYQDISAQHWTEVALAATRDQLAQTEQQAAEHNRLALQLQHAIMPPTEAPVDAPGLRIAVRYRPAEKEHLVGGDWYDAVVLPSNQVLISVGDITGHGVGAATGMVVLRNALRGLAATGAGPAQLLAWLNLVARHLADNVLATAICGLFDPPTRTLTWARAGHLPPVLVRGGVATALPTPRGLMLGVLTDSDYDESQVQLEEGDVLLFYTDGLVERRDLPLDDCIDRLLTSSTASSGGLEARLDHLLVHTDADTDDDTCVVGVEVR
jgi:serine phosphatase RsbU (regulator of sigma subunit)/PAS domain-containing protein